MKTEVKPSKKIGFFQDAPNSNSFMRLMSFLVWILQLEVNNVILFKGYYYTNPFDSMFVWFMCIFNFLCLIAIFYPKYLQKILELGIAGVQKIKGGFTSTLPSQSPPSIKGE